MASLTVYGTPISTYVRTVRLLLEEVGADYTLKSVNIFNGECTSPDYLAKHPFGKVPSLDVDGNLIYETVAITQFLDATLAENQFSPSDPLQRAKMHQIMAIVDSYLYSQSIHAIVIQRLIVPSQGGTSDEALITTAVPKVKAALEAIEAITVGSPYLLGETITLADFYLIPIFVYLSMTPEYDIVIAEVPKLKAWWETVRELPNVAKVCR